MDNVARQSASTTERELHNGIGSRTLYIVIVDDSTVAREGIAAIIRRHLRYATCKLASDEQSMEHLLQQHQPDLLLIEPFAGNRDGVFFLKELKSRFPDTRILVISRQPEEVYAERALRAGACGYWMKTGSCEELIHGVETVLAGELYVSPGIALRAVHKVVERVAARGLDGNLTDRELHVFALTGSGLGTRSIAKELGISPKTVETYYEHIKVKLGYVDAAALQRGAHDWFKLSHHK